MDIRTVSLDAGEFQRVTTAVIPPPPRFVESTPLSKLQ